MKLQTTLVAYRFDVYSKAGKEEWKRFRTELEATEGRGHRFGPVFHAFDTFGIGLGPDPESGFEFGRFAEIPVTLDTGENHINLFSNQWNASLPGGKSARVFDWFLQAYHGGEIKDSSGRDTRQGHYLQITQDMRELRANILKCSYCGAKYPAPHDSEFCTRCLSSSYLETKDLPLLRLYPVSSVPKDLPKDLPEGLLDAFKQGQRAGDERKAQKAREKVLADYEKARRNAENEKAGFLWLLDRGFNADNVIYYKHTEKFCFGWRSEGLDETQTAVVLGFVSEFPFAYEIKRKGLASLQGY